MNIFEDDRIKFFMLCIIIVLQVITVSTIILCSDCFSNKEKEDINEIALIDKEEEDIPVTDGISTTIKVDVKGAVKKSGVYELDSNSRVVDAINLAGGLKSNASTKYLNLSKKVTDEMVIYVYTNNQIKNMSIVEDVKEVCNCPTIDTSSCAGSNVIVSDKEDTIINSDTKEEVSESKISLNNASKEELMTLSGVGESKADSIIEYRTKNNGFKSLEDIMNVSGIGESLYNKIKDSITL